MAFKHIYRFVLFSWSGTRSATAKGAEWFSQEWFHEKNNIHLKYIQDTVQDIQNKQKDEIIYIAVSTIFVPRIQGSVPFIFLLKHKDTDIQCAHFRCKHYIIRRKSMANAI